MPTTPYVFGPTQLAEIQHTHPAARVIDVRTPAEFATGHIVGSYNVPLPDLGEHRNELTAASAGPVVLVCQSGRRATLAQQQLAAAGLHQVHVLDGGVVAWSATGRPLRTVDRGHGWPIERQVRGIAGTIVAASIAASIPWPTARYVAGAVGAGLFVAALTNTCAMGMLLARMPWNRTRGAVCDMPTVVTALTESDPTVESR